MWEFLDKVIYINLDSRQDRRDLMAKFFKEGQIPEEKIIRYSAIRWNPGATGCSKSHLGAIKLAKKHGWKRVLILEDDVEWYDFQEGYQKLEKLVQLPKWDVCLVGGWYGDVEENRIKASICAHAYIVNFHYYDTLIKNYEEGIQKRLLSKNDIHSVDVYWIKLQIQDNWIGVINPMCIQTQSFSNIQNKVEPHKTLNPNDTTKNMIKHYQRIFLQELYTVKFILTAQGFVKTYVKK